MTTMPVASLLVAKCTCIGAVWTPQLASRSTCIELLRLIVKRSRPSCTSESRSRFYHLRLYIQLDLHLRSMSIRQRRITILVVARFARRTSDASACVDARTEWPKIQ